MTTIKKKPEEGEERLIRLDELAKELPLYTEADYVTSTKITPSGSLALDLAIGIGGYPSGCIIDVFGVESSGKSLLSIMAMAQIQKAGGVAVVWDVERSYSKNTAWLKVNGVDPSKLRYIKLRPEQGCEYGMDAVEKIASASPTAISSSGSTALAKTTGSCLTCRRTRRNCAASTANPRMLKRRNASGANSRDCARS